MKSKIKNGLKKQYENSNDINLGKIIVKKENGRKDKDQSSKKTPKRKRCLIGFSKSL
jgi:hypothetical protein